MPYASTFFKFSNRSCLMTSHYSLREWIRVFTLLIITGTSFNSCQGEDKSVPGWIPPGGNLQNTLYYARPSPVSIHNLELFLQWNSGLISAQHSNIGFVNVQLLSTGSSWGKMLLGVFGTGTFLFQADGRLIFQKELPSSGVFADLEGKGFCSMVVSTSEGIFYYDARGNICKSFSIPYIIWEMKTCDLDNDGKIELLISGKEADLAPREGFEAFVLGKRFVRCYDAKTLKPLWEYRTATLPHLAAFADIDNDGYQEIFLGTYSFENGVTWEDMTDKGHGYVIALNHLGRRLWLQTFEAEFANIWPSVADLDGDGNMEIAVACANWLRDWGRVVILNPGDGSIRYQFPPTGNLNYSITTLGIADLDGNGIAEIVCSSAGKYGTYFLLDNVCNKTGIEYRISPSSMDFDYINCQLEALNDLDGDGKVEIIGSAYVEKYIIQDPRFNYSKCTEPQVFVLSWLFKPIAIIPLEDVCNDVIVSDLIRGDTNELIIFSNEVSVWGIKERGK